MISTRVAGKAKRPRSRFKLAVETLEHRLVLSTDPVVGLVSTMDDHSRLYDTYPAIDILTDVADGTSSTTSTTTAASSALAVPSYSSLPGAMATIYLNFSGETLSSWLSFTNVVTPAYDIDSDATTFSATELINIEKIWRYVSEDYAPFNMNVTTVDPRTLGGYAGHMSQINIGGNGSWTGGTYGGIGQVGGFGTSSVTNPIRGFVFPANLGNGNPKYVGDASGHESGHNMGLQHQSLYSGTTLSSKYYSGPGDGTAPTMGSSYGAARSMWWYGTSNSSTTYQSDLNVIAANDQVGFRADDHANNTPAATPLGQSGGAVTGAGIIETMSDVDYFTFSTNPGQISLTVTVPQPFNTLSARMELRDSAGALIASAAPGTNFGATISANVATAGTYYLVVASSGPSAKSTATNYGFNVGSYTITGTIATISTTVAAPSNLSAGAAGSTSQLTLSWLDNATNETSYSLERSSDAGASWNPLANLASNTSTYLDSSLAAGSTFLYRVRAIAGSLNSDYSNVASGTTVTQAPGGLLATAVSASQISLSWNDVAGDTGYKIERSTDGMNWTQIGTTGTNTTTYQSAGLSAATTYYYRVRSTNSGGDSAYSNPASAQTLTAVAVPSAPSGLTATASTGAVYLTWLDNANNELGYFIERSSNGGKAWSQVAQLGANATQYTDGSVSSRKTYLYRVYAYNSGGNSAYSNIAQVTTPRASTRGALAFADDASDPVAGQLPMTGSDRQQAAGIPEMREETKSDHGIAGGTAEATMANHGHSSDEQSLSLALGSPKVMDLFTVLG